MGFSSSFPVFAAFPAEIKDKLVFAEQVEVLAGHFFEVLGIVLEAVDFLAQFFVGGVQALVFRPDRPQVAGDLIILPAAVGAEEHPGGKGGQDDRHRDR